MVATYISIYVLMFYINYEECKFLIAASHAYLNSLFYINYEECKYGGNSDKRFEELRFILTMRNVNSQETEWNTKGYHVLY